MSRDRAIRAKRAALARGRRAEALALWWLRLKGYRIVGRNLRTPAGEIDILARRGRTLAVVEVKRRASGEAAAEALAPHQRRRLSRAASLLLAKRPQWAALALRFDALLVGPWGIRHLPDAWREEPGQGNMAARGRSRSGWRR